MVTYHHPWLWPLLAVTSGFRARIMSLALGRSAGFSDVQQQNNWITGLMMQSAAWNLAGRGGLVPNAAKYSSVSQEPSSSSSVLSPVSPSSSLSMRETKFIPQQCTCGLLWKYKKQGSLKAPATGKNHCLVVTEELTIHSECLFWEGFFFWPQKQCVKDYSIKTRKALYLFE